MLEREAVEAALEDELQEEFEPVAEPTQPQFRASDLLPDMSFILSPTGDGSIDDYTDHPMNPKGSKGTARILRGATGMLGSLNYAIIDIALGAVELMKEGKAVEQTSDRA